MEKVLSQEEVHALFRAARQGGISEEATPSQKQPQKVTNFDAREAGHISKEQVAAISNLHESFARSLTNSLGAFLRVGFDVNLVSVEQLNYSEVLSRLPELTYLCSLRIQPMEAFALLQMDLSIAFPIMDLVLGGPGKGSEEPRELTEIEEQILESVVKILVRELQAAWVPVFEVAFQFEQRQRNTQAMSLMPPSERSLALSFEIRMPEARGMLNVALPAMASNTLLRKLSVQFSYFKVAGASAYADLLRTQMLESFFQAELQLPPSQVRAQELVALELGQVLVLNQQVRQPAVLRIAEQDMFLAYPVACGTLRGGKIQQMLSMSAALRKETP